jgi:hypothetical protein
MLSKAVPDDATIASKWSIPPRFTKFPTTVSVNYSDRDFPAMPKQKSRQKSSTRKPDSSSSHTMQQPEPPSNQSEHRTQPMDASSTHSNATVVSGGTAFTKDDCTSLFMALTESMVEKFEKQNDQMMEIIRTQQIREAKQDEKIDKMMEAFMRLIPAKPQEIVPNQSHRLSPNYQATTNRPLSPRLPPIFQPGMAKMDTTYTGTLLQTWSSDQWRLKRTRHPSTPPTRTISPHLRPCLPTIQPDATEGDYSFSEFESRKSHDFTYRSHHSESSSSTDDSDSSESTYNVYDEDGLRRTVSNQNLLPEASKLDPYPIFQTPTKYPGPSITTLEPGNSTQITAYDQSTTLPGTDDETEWHGTDLNEGVRHPATTTTLSVDNRRGGRGGRGGRGHGHYKTNKHSQPTLPPHTNQYHQHDESVDPQISIANDHGRCLTSSVTPEKMPRPPLFQLTPLPQANPPPIP